MASRTAGQVGRPKKGNASETKAHGIAIRGSKEWREWVTALAEFRRLKSTDLVDQALVEYAEKHGFTKPAPKR